MATRQSTTERTTIVVAGHIDHGKSTVLGRLLLQCGDIPDDKIASVEALCAHRNEVLQPAYFLDAFEDEQSHGITIDTAVTTVRAHGQCFELIDVPGHVQLVKNMTTGASRANGAILVVDAERGVEAQTECHMRILALLGITSVVLAVNKMDIVEFSQQRYSSLTERVEEQLNLLGLKMIASIPISALRGDNINFLSDSTMQWYSGKTLIDSLMLSQFGGGEKNDKLRLTVQDVYNFDSRDMIAGKVVSGVLREGDTLCFSPSGKCATVDKLVQYAIDFEARISATTRGNYSAKFFDTAYSGDSVSVILSDSAGIVRGETASLVHQALPAITNFGAFLVWISLTDFCDGSKYILKVGTQECAAQVRAIRGTPTETTTGSVFEVQISTDMPVVFEASTPELTNFVLCDSSETVAAGRFTSALLGTAQSEAKPMCRIEAGFVERKEREVRQSHRGAVIWLTGLPSSGKSTLARSLERKLFEQGKCVVVLDADNLRQGLCSDLGFTDEDRLENVRRIAHAAALMLRAGMIVIVTCISPYASSRADARNIIGKADFHEVFVSCPLNVCQQRDPKGFYKRAARKEIDSFTGISAPYEPPRCPELIVDTADCTLEESVQQALDYVQSLELSCA